MTAKKQLVQIKAFPGSSAPQYSLGSVNFAYVSSPATGRVQITELMTCREYVIKKVWHAVNDYEQNKNVPAFDLSKLRLLIAHDPSNFDDFRRRLFNGKAALNLLEKFNDWSPSTITTVKHPHYKNAWLLTAPAEWMSQPQLLSIATWVLRLLSNDGPINTDNYDAFEAGLIQIKSKGGSTSDNYSYLNVFWDKLYITMRYHKEIFGDISLSDAWPGVDTTDYLHINGGLQTFAEEHVGYTKNVETAQKRFRALCKEHLPRKNELIKGGK
jgi:hypothetical protein